MKLTTHGPLYVLHCEYEERNHPKAAGFVWHPANCHRKACPACKEGFGKGWYSQFPQVAAKMIEYADPQLREILKSVAEDRTNRINASMAADIENVSYPVPDGLDYFPFQKAGIHYALECFARRKGCIIADEMGLGKTIQAIGCINATPYFKRALIICPASVKINWKRECERWLSRPMTVAVADSKYWPDHADVVIMNYDILAHHFNDLRREKWNLLVLDEAHFVKNSKAQRTIHITGGKLKLDGVKMDIDPLPADYKLLLTGTPVENRPKEIYPLASFCDPTLWPNEWAFMNAYYRMETVMKPRRGRKGLHPTKEFTEPRNLDALQEKLRANVMIRRRTFQVIKDLPELRRQVIEIPSNGISGRIGKETELYLQFESLQREINSARERDHMDALGSLKNDGYEGARRTLMQLKADAQEALNHIATLRKENALAKMPYVMPYITEALESVDKLVIFAYHREVVEELHRRIPDSAIFYGTTNQSDRQKAIDDFQNGPLKVFIASIGSGSYGITLTAAQLLICLEFSWKPGEMQQMEKRIHRIGQTSSVLIQYLVMEGSIDSVLANKNAEKWEQITQSIDMLEG